MDFLHIMGTCRYKTCFSIFNRKCLSLIPSSKTINTTVYDSTPYIQSGIEPIDSGINNYLGDNYFEGATVPAQNTSNILTILGIVWITGIIVMLMYTFISFLKIKKSVNESALLKKNIWICYNIDTPFILGVLKPRIYIPSSLSEQDAQYVLAHEKAHLKRLDHLWKPLGFFILSFYWFNPVLWIAYVLLCRDIENACDEKVIREKGNEIKKAYSIALLNCSIPRKNITACLLAFGETGVKERVKGVLSYKKPAFWIIVVAVIVVVITSVCLLTNPKNDKLNSSSTNVNLITASTNCDLVSYEFVDSKIEDGHLLITAQWTNNSDKEFSFGEEFVIYKDGEILNPKPNVSWLAIANLILPQQSIEETYDLTFYYNITENGEYRLEKEFSSLGDSTYKAYIEFVIGDVSNVGGVDEPQNIYTSKDKQQTNSTNDETIEYIDNSLLELSKVPLNDYDELITNIETKTNAEFQNDIGSGRYVLEFKYNDDISFRVFDVPMESWIILLDDEIVIENSKN